jgi:hypothetical protein
MGAISLHLFRNGSIVHVFLPNIISTGLKPVSCLGVFRCSKENENWKLGQIIDQCNPRSYVVQNEDGVKYRRNRVKIRPTDITANIRDRSPPRSVTTEKPVNTENIIHGNFEITVHSVTINYWNGNTNEKFNYYYASLY